MRPVLDLSLYLVLDPDLCGGLPGMLETARQAAGSGASVVQLRAPQWKKRQWLEAAWALKALLEPFQVPLIINDQIDVALAMGAAGVHIGQQDLPARVTRELIGPERWLGLSVSNAAEMDAAETALIDYLGVGPVYSTGTKPDASPVIGVEGFAGLVGARQCPVVAIGGIGSGRAAPLIRAAADGVAVVSAICGQSDPAAATRALRQEISAARAQTAAQ